MEVMMKLLQMSLMSLKHQRRRKRNGKSGKHNVRYTFLSPLYIYIYIVLSVLSLYMVFRYDHSLAFQEYVVMGRASVLALTI